ncbi:efflux RND transporter permease subunit [Microvirga zambiensis]|uniref:efflux RND transporter permease subunit n=1 Tax=Microvirga zambiensis TaxID=1402137 RepID=UPI00191E4FAB|nr:efflux RND transporter permease subunit [Microvirga zambiensis]
MNRISSWSIYNPIPTIVLFLVLTLAGLYGYGQLRINNMPDTDMPTVTVTARQTGASPTELQAQVTQVIENAVSALRDVEDVSSTVTEGSSVTTIEFELGTDLDRATSDVQSAVSSIRANLPAAVEAPTVTRVEATGNAILTYVIEAPGMSPDELSWYVDNDLVKQLLGVTGVSSIKGSGGVDRIIWVKLDPDRLASLGISATEISQTLANVNVNQPGGRVTLGGQEQSVRTLGSAPTVQALAETTITLNGGRQVRLADLGTVEDTWSTPRQRARFDGKEVVAFSVYRSVGSSEIHATAAVRRKVAAISAGRSDVAITEVTSSADFVEESYDAAVEALWLGALLAIGVVYVFLRDIRATLVSAVAMPLSLIPTFAVMAWFDLSLNTISLLALSLVVGILVDDAIVEIENIVRHMRQSGKSAYQAALEAADEIGLAVVATTATLVAVFLPVAFMPGMPGQIFMSFGIAVAVSVLFSLLVARMLTPLMGAYLVRAGGHDKGTSFWVPTYPWFLRKALRFRWLTLILGIVFFAVSIALATQLPTEFMPSTDRGRSMISVELPPGATLAETDAAVLRVTELLKGEPEVKSIFASIGTPSSSDMGPASGSSASEVRSATVTVSLVDRRDRSRSQQEFEAANAAKLATIPGARISFGAGGFSGSTVSVTLVSDNTMALNSASNQLLNEMATIPGLLNPTSSAATAKPELIVTPDLDRAAEIGVTPATIAKTVNVATLGDTSTNLAKFNLGDRQISIQVSLADGVVNDPEQLANLPVTGTRATVPLGSVARISFGAGPNTIERINRTQSATIEADLAGLTLGEVTQRIRVLPIMQNLPEGVAEMQRGDVERMQEMFSGFAVAIVSGILLMYFTLVLLFKSFVQPITILVALPLSVGGALGFLLLAGSSLGISTLIGILMLMGIAAKNSILLVEYALVALEQGSDRFSALLDGASKRARPIVMTSIAMGAGMLPIALGIGADAETRAPMAIAVIGGLVSSTLLSLIYVPVVFTFMDDLQRFLGRWLGRLLVEKGRPSPPTGEAVLSQSAMSE